MKQKRLILLSVLVCAAALTACGEPAAVPVDQLQTPQYSLAALPEIDFSALPEEEIHTSDSGVKVIVPESRKKDMQSPETVPFQKESGEPDSPMLSGEAPGELPERTVTPETVWEGDNTVTYNAYTLPDKAALNKEGCVGILSIPTISLNMNVYEAADDMAAMLHGGAHYKSTSCYDGNVAVSAHVSGVPASASFENLDKLEIGDAVSYQTAIGTRSYTVAVIEEIEQNDWSYLGRTTDNRITMTTCITGKPDKRLLVQAVEEQ